MANAKKNKKNDDEQPYGLSCLQQYQQLESVK